MTERVKIEGLRELDKALGELGNKSTERSVLRRVAKGALEIFVERARELAPVDTGTLRDSITIGSSLNRNAKKQERGMPKGSFRLFAGTGNRHAVPAEFGTFKQPARPFMRPAFDATDRAMLDHVRKNLGREIEKTAARVAKRRTKK